MLGDGAPNQCKRCRRCDLDRREPQRRDALPEACDKQDVNGECYGRQDFQRVTSTEMEAGRHSQQDEAAGGQDDAEGCRYGRKAAKDERADHRCEHDEHARDEAGVGCSRVLEADGLERVAGEERYAGDRAGSDLFTLHIAEGTDRRQDGGCEPEPDPDEEERWHARDRVLDDREGRAPDQGDADESKLPSIRFEAVQRAHEVVRYTLVSRWSRTPSRR